jgi:hypothetical protein
MLFENYEQYQKAIEKASPLCRELGIIGEYSEGKVYMD